MRLLPFLNRLEFSYVCLASLLGHNVLSRTYLARISHLPKFQQELQNEICYPS